jgi:uncharacterized heparinase superfamily protein
LRVGWRRNGLYRSLLKGRMPDRIGYQPDDALTRRLQEADALFKGRFRFADETVAVAEGSVFDCPAPSRAWIEGLHGFDWLSPLATANGDAARVLAARLMTEWLARNGRYGEPAWLPEVTARRLVQIFSHGRFMLANSDMLWRSRVFVSLREQSRLLARTVSEAEPGLPRLEAAAANVLAGICLSDGPRRVDAALDRLEGELAEQILPDGGHVSRSPEQLLEAYRHIAMATEALLSRRVAVPPGLRSAHDRVAPMLRFFRHGDGGLAMFNGGREGDPRMISNLLERDEVRGQPFLHAPHSGYQRLAAPHAIVILDCGAPPKGALSRQAHAGCLSFEMSTGGQRLVVNCGAELSRWNGALRATAAHSTITLADTSMAGILPAGLLHDLLGARLTNGPVRIDTARENTQQGSHVVARHDGYLHTFGLLHERRMILSPQGTRLSGKDRLVPAGAQARRSPVPFAARFHIHPDVRVSRSQRGDILLKLPSGEGWRFRFEGDASVEESVYAGGETVRRAEQLVICGAVKEQPVEFEWGFERIGSA